jgi:hypothetical protein
MRIREETRIRINICLVGARAGETNNPDVESVRQRRDAHATAHQREHVLQMLTVQTSR